MAKFENMTLSYTQIASIPFQTRKNASGSLLDALSRDLTPGQRVALFPSYVNQVYASGGVKDGDKVNPPEGGGEGPPPSVDATVEKAGPPRPGKGLTTTREIIPGGLIPDPVTGKPMRVPDQRIASSDVKTGDRFQDVIKNYKSRMMKDLGITDFQADGVLGNLAQESDRFRAYNEYGGGPGIGWAQWTTKQRKEAFLTFASENSLDPKSDEASYLYLVHEIKNRPDLLPGGAKTLDKLRATANAEEAAMSFMDNFERPGVPHFDTRLKYTNEIAGIPYLEDSLNETERIPNVYDIPSEENEATAEPLRISSDIDSAAQIISPLQGRAIEELAGVTSDLGETTPGKRRGFLADRSFSGGGDRLHAGSDFYGKEGESAVATENGVVIRAQKQQGYNGTVDVLHTGPDGRQYVTRYAHLNDKFPIKVGDSVSAGDIVGTLDGDNHLHFEVRDYEAYKVSPFARPSSNMDREDAAKLGLYDPSDYFGRQGRFAPPEEDGQTAVATTRSLTTDNANTQPVNSSDYAQINFGDARIVDNSDGSKTITWNGLDGKEISQTIQPDTMTPDFSDKRGMIDLAARLHYNLPITGMVNDQYTGPVPEPYTEERKEASRVDHLARMSDEVKPATPTATPEPKKQTLQDITGLPIGNRLPTKTPPGYNAAAGGAEITDPSMIISEDGKKVTRVAETGPEKLSVMPRHKSSDVFQENQILMQEARQEKDREEAAKPDIATSKSSPMMSDFGRSRETGQPIAISTVMPRITPSTNKAFADAKMVGRFNKADIDGDMGIVYIDRGYA